MIIIKSQEDIKKIKQAAEIWKKVREKLYLETKVGISTKELDEIANQVIQENNAKAAFYNYLGFEEQDPE